MYTVTTDDQSQQQVDALPADALVPFAEKNRFDLAIYHTHRHQPIWALTAAVSRFLTLAELRSGVPIRPRK